MSEAQEERHAERIDRIVSDVVAGRHLKATPSDAADYDAIRMAARLAGSREGYPRMSPAFRRRLAGMLAKGEAPSWINRRSALVAGLGLAAGAVGGAIGGAIGSEIARMASASRPARGRMEPRSGLGRWVDTGLVLADLEEGIPRRVTAGAIGAFLVRRGDHVLGMSSYCTHVPCELVWLADRGVLNCPCHNVPFDLDGRSRGSSYPPLPSLPTVKVRIQSDGRVEVLGT
jgi:nitrite reductase/ring-hydroxylating ferredoxin subunit